MKRPNTDCQACQAGRATYHNGSLCSLKSSLISQICHSLLFHRLQRVETMQQQVVIFAYCLPEMCPRL